MGRTEIEEKVFAVVLACVPAGSGACAIGPHASLRRDLGLDSLALVAMLARVGDALGVDADDVVEAMGETPIITVGDVVALGERLARGLTEAL
jgi:acyl carrier protein